MFKIKPSSSQPIYEQIITQVKESIIKGVLREGEKLPSVRDLAEMTRVNPNTISKAYKSLEQERIISTVRGRGTFVADNLDIKTNTKDMENLKTKLKDIIIELHYFGVHEKDACQIIEEIYSELGKEADHA